VWLFSIGALFGVQIIVILGWAAVLQASGSPPFEDQQEFLRWIESPPVVLVSVASSVVAHLLTLALCWAMVTRFGRRSLLDSLGWRWLGPPVVVKILMVIGTTVLMLAIFFVLERTLPASRETAFDRLLKTSQQVRVAVAFLAVFSAPIVEEVVYRGVLFSALRNRTGVISAVLVVTILFGAVHFVQYWGAWSSLVGVTLLSFVLTVIRAVTRSLKPCVAIHLLNNVVGALGILGGGS
jgi:membrane protease YdiL (CAAX protease family)